MHERIVEGAGFPIESRLVGAWPAASLGSLPLALPYCDDLAVVARSPEAAQEGLDRVAAGFAEVGFNLYEFETASTDFVILGHEGNGASGRLRPKGSRVWNLGQALLWAVEATISGAQLEVLLGHYVTHCGINRGGLAVPRAVFELIRVNYTRVMPLWASVRCELRVMRGLLPLWCAT